MDRRRLFGEQLKALRLHRGLSQERLAHLARLHRTYVGAVERGERNISLLNIWRLAEALNVQPSDFFENGASRTSRSSKAVREGLLGNAMGVRRLPVRRNRNGR